MDYDLHVDPELRDLLLNAPRRDGLEASELVGIRNAMKTSWAEPSGQVRTDIVVSPRAPGQEPLRILVNQPIEDSSKLRPCLVWIHGGGYMLGAPEMDQLMMEQWVLNHDCVVVAPDYRLAPENPYPRPLDDCRLALELTVARAKEFKIASDSIVVGGISAGAGLAAALALQVRHSDLPRIVGQLLLFPMLDDRFQEHASSHLGVTGWGSGANYLGWKSYLGCEPGATEVSPYASVARATSLDNLPHSFIGAGDMDILRDDAIAYMNRLVEASVPVDFHLYHGGTHGFISQAPLSEMSLRLNTEVGAFLSRCFRYGSRHSW